MRKIIQQIPRHKSRENSNRGNDKKYCQKYRFPIRSKYKPPPKTKFLKKNSAATKIQDTNNNT